MMNQKMDKKDLEFILYISLGTLTGLIGLVAALFIAYIANYKKYGRIIVGFLIGWLIYVIFILHNLFHMQSKLLIYSFFDLSSLII